MKNSVAIIAILSLSLSLVSCSGHKSEAASSSDEPSSVEVSAESSNDTPTDALASESETTPQETITANGATPKEEYVEVDPANTKEEVVGAEEAPLSASVAPAKSATPVTAAAASTVKIKESGETKTYTVGKNETLMLIAFKLYGDFRQWRKIAKQNQTTLKNGQAVSAGMILKYTAPESEFVWSPQGEPYLIKNGDSLSLISKNVYDTLKRWKDIWSNNKVLIRDPNKIYAGFTLYYVPDSKKVASK